ncbi:hypothetical protein BD777DRAFT_127295 [Yarrowia lipolytica]|nr:hypothetical protein BD777DRAFT_127295 [Yarrowia lipolytica]
MQAVNRKVDTDRRSDVKKQPGLDMLTLALFYYIYTVSSPLLSNSHCNCSGSDMFRCDVKPPTLVCRRW